MTIDVFSFLIRGHERKDEKSFEGWRFCSLMQYDSGTEVCTELV